MNLSELTDFSTLAEKANISVDEMVLHDFSISDEYSSIESTVNGIEIHINFYKENGFAQNDPNYHCDEFTVVLDENLDELRIEG